jgi:signal peptidase I
MSMVVVVGLSADAARQAGASYRLQRCNRMPVYLSFAALGLVANFTCGQVMKGALLEIVVIPSASNLPTIATGDRVLVAKFGPRATPRRGDLVMFLSPRNPGTRFLKRVVGLGGDSVDERLGSFYVNGQPLDRKALGSRTVYERVEGTDQWVSMEMKVFEEAQGPSRYEIGLDPIQPQRESNPADVPQGTAFLVGDNRTNSMDSRFFGAVPLANILGRAECLLWSSGHEGLSLRRFGTPL